MLVSIAIENYGQGATPNNFDLVVAAQASCSMERSCRSREAIGMHHPDYQEVITCCHVSCITRRKEASRERIVLLELTPLRISSKSDAQVDCFVIILASTMLSTIKGSFRFVACGVMTDAKVSIEGKQKYERARVTMEFG